MVTILISGGTGLVGRHLCKKLKDKGYCVAILSTGSRNDTNIDIPTYTWNINNQEIDIEAIKNADYIIHLAGANIGEKRWTKKRKQQIIDSRVKTGQLIFDKLIENKNKLRAFISASAIGYYGTTTTNKIYCETDLPSNDFLGEVCQQWEQSADRFEALPVRTVKIRTGVVLTKKGGALSKMITPIKMGIGSAIGNGKQYIPWIHIDDLCGIFIKAIEDTQMDGVYNAVAPNHITNKNFIKTLACVLKKPFWFPNFPANAMKILFGKMSEMFLQGSRISSYKIRSAGYNFLFPDLESALINLFRKTSAQEK